MKTPVIKIIDRIFTQALKRYRDMEAQEAVAAIESEWPEQTAAMMIKLLFNNTCSSCGVALDLIELPRASGFGSYLHSVSTCEDLPF